MKTIADALMDPELSIHGLNYQVAQQFVRGVPAASIRDLSQHVSLAPGVVLPYLQRSAADALIGAIRNQGTKPQILSMWRMLPDQYVRWKCYLNGSLVVAVEAPGSSAHERGVAIAIDDPESWIKPLRDHGWEWCGQKDAHRFNYHGPQDPTFGSTAIWAFQRVWNTHNPDDQLATDGVLRPETIAKLEQSPVAGF